MSKATVALDFFGMEKDTSSSKSQFQKFLDRRRSFRGMQSAIAKIDPEVLRSVIVSGSANQSSENGDLIDSKKSVSVPSSPNGVQAPFPALPVLNRNLRPASEISSGIAPLTIFYHGTVAVFDVHQDKVDTILKLAVKGSSMAVESGDPKVAVTLNGDLPIARRMSLQRFLEKRKER